MPVSIFTRYGVLALAKDFYNESRRGGDVTLRHADFHLDSWSSRLDILLSLAHGLGSSNPEESDLLFTFVHAGVQLVRAGQNSMAHMNAIRDEEGFAFDQGDEWEITYFDGVRYGETVMAVIDHHYRDGVTPCYFLRYSTGGKLSVSEGELWTLTNSSYASERRDLLAQMRSFISDREMEESHE